MIFWGSQVNNIVLCIVIKFRFRPLVLFCQRCSTLNHSTRSEKSPYQTEFVIEHMVGRGVATFIFLIIKFPPYSNEIETLIRFLYITVI